MSLTSRLSNVLGSNSSLQSTAIQHDGEGEQKYSTGGTRQNMEPLRNSPMMEEELDSELERPPYLHVG